MPIELESTGIKVNAVSPVFTKTNLNGYAATETVEEGAAEAVRVALLGLDGPTGHARKTPDAPVVILGASSVISSECFEQPFAIDHETMRGRART
jgi:NAD(P)-dependent dehydrogenase (short-subunit alcohol dehydrogenase family)